MPEHKWLTVGEVEECKDAGVFDRFVPDWLEMRKLTSMQARGWWIPDYPYEDEPYVYEPQCRYCLVTGVNQTNADNPEIDQKDWCPYKAYLDMIEATADD